jgi:hypothetical protein
MNRLVQLESEVSRARTRAKAQPRPAAMARALSSAPPSLVRTRAMSFDLGEPVRWSARALEAVMPAMPGPDAVVGYARVGHVTPHLAVRKLPDRSSVELEQLGFNTRVLVLARLSSPKDWALVITDKGNLGYVNALFLFFNPPEPNAILYKLEKGDSPIGVAEKFYRHGVGWGHDLRFYVNVLVYANRGEGDQRKGIHKDSKDDSWRATETKAGYYIWVPTLAFADSLRGVVSSGSISYELWQQVVGVWDWIKFGLAFVGGLLHGAFASIWDLVTGAIDLIEMVWQLLKSIFTGTIISGAKQLWDALDKLTWQDVEELVGGWFAGVKAKWNHASAWKRGHFRGYVVGYIIAEILLAIFTVGIATALKWGGRLGKAVKILKKLKLDKVIDAAEELHKKAKGKADDLRKTLAKRRARKEVTKVLDARTAEKLIAEIGEEAAAELVESLGHKLARELAGTVDGKTLQALAKKPGKDVLDKVGSTAIKRLVAKGMTPDELADWATDLTATVLKKYAEKFDWEVLKHYGKKFWKKWRGITAGTMDHVLKARRKTRPNGSYYISGGHEPKDLKRVVDATGVWQGTTPHATMPGAGVAKFDLNRSGHIAKKTVMPDLDTNPRKWTAPCEEAIDEALASRRVPKQLTAPEAAAPGDIPWEGKDKAGRVWKGYLKNPRSTTEPIEELVTFYPG